MGMLQANTGAAFQAGDRGSVVRRDFVSQAARFSGNRRLQLLAQHSQFLTQLLDLLLLAIDGAIERLEQIVGETQLDFDPSLTLPRHIFHPPPVTARVSGRQVAKSLDTWIVDCRP